VPLEDIVLMPETDARRALGRRSLHLKVLAPLGVAGRGVLRVLRCKPASEDAIELVCGYESYEPL